MILGCSFVGLRDATRLRRAVDGSSTRLRRESRCRGSPLGGAPFARGESYKRVGSQAPHRFPRHRKHRKRDLTRSGPEALRICSGFLLPGWLPGDPRPFPNERSLNSHILCDLNLLIGQDLTHFYLTQSLGMHLCKRPTIYARCWVKESPSR